jgi:phage-related protein
VAEPWRLTTLFRSTCEFALTVMSDPAYRIGMANAPERPAEKPVVWLHGEIKTPPFSKKGRIEAGVLLGRLQQGEKLMLPHARPMPSVGARCAELRVRDEQHNWRIMYRLDTDAVVILDVFAKTTKETPDKVIGRCQTRLAKYDAAKKRLKRKRNDR